MNDDGGAAFPVDPMIIPYKMSERGASESGGTFRPGSHGLSIRDWFAGQALMGILACPHNSVVDGISTKSSVSKVAYLLADAMLAERKKREGF